MFLVLYIVQYDYAIGPFSWANVKLFIGMPQNDTDLRPEETPNVVHVDKKPHCPDLGDVSARSRLSTFRNHTRYKSVRIGP